MVNVELINPPRALKKEERIAAERGDLGIVIVNTRENIMALEVRGKKIASNMLFNFRDSKMLFLFSSTRDLWPRTLINSNRLGVVTVTREDLI